MHDEADAPSPDKVIETAYVKPEGEGSTDEETDLNATIVSGEDVEPSSSIWEGIMGLVEDIDRDSKLVDVSIPL